MINDSFIAIACLHHAKPFPEHHNFPPSFNILHWTSSTSTQSEWPWPSWSWPHCSHVFLQRSLIRAPSHPCCSFHFGQSNANMLGAVNKVRAGWYVQCCHQLPDVNKHDLPAPCMSDLDFLYYLPFRWLRESRHSAKQSKILQNIFVMQWYWWMKN